MKLTGFWADLQKEVNKHPFVAHPVYRDMAAGKLKPKTIAELMAQLKYCVTEGIGALAMIIPQVPRDLKAELAENVFYELKGTKKMPAHWLLAIRTGAATGVSEADIDKKPMLAETKVYPDTVSAYATRGHWLEALSFVAIGIEDLFHDYSRATAKALRDKYGFDDDAAYYFDIHVGADEEHGATGWKAAMKFAKTDAQKQSVRRAALEGRNMWWNMYSAVYKKGEGKDAPYLRFDA